MDTKFLKEISIIVIGSVISILGWFVKAELADVTTTLKEIKLQAEEANRRVILLEQKVDYKSLYTDREVERIRADCEYWKDVAVVLTQKQKKK